VALFRLSPAGRAPLSTDHVIGAVPMASRAWLYAVPTVPPGRAAVLITGAAGAGLMAMLRAFVASPAAFSAFTVKLAVPSAAGVPDISPVDLFRLNPAGRLPPAIDHVIGAVPLALRASLYTAPTVPPARDCVLIAGATVVGFPCGVTEFDGSDGGLSPALLVAMTVNM
jgi:hypothetical protein